MAIDAGFKVEVSRQHADDPVGTVIDHEPASGRLLNEGSRVRLVVSSGPKPVALPTITGKSLEEARGILEGAGFEVSSREDYDENVPAGAVAVQEPPAGEEVVPGSAVELVVSRGPRPVEVPDVAGRTVDEATRMLTERRFTVERRDVHDDDVAAGRVIRTDPRAGSEAARDSAVTLVVSLGPDLVAVPDVVGEDVDDAIEELEELGFEVDLFGYRRGRSVNRQDPDPGDRLRRGGTVTLFF
jgi:serine/threonine-protein kinase